jgi:hypothetical protein
MNSQFDYKYSDLHEVLPLPGVYAWYLQYDNSSSPQKFHDFFTSKKFDVTVKGNLKEKYSGPIDQDSDTFDQNQIDLDLLECVINSFNVPIYVGVSKNLKNRLSTHKNSLNERWVDPGVSVINSGDKIILDSDEESTYFAHRVATKIKNRFGINSLIIKVVYCDKNYNKSYLFPVENFINRTFFPLVGRR